MCLFISHSGYVSLWSFSPAVKKWIFSVSWWTTVEIMSALLYLLFCHCFREDWANGSTYSPTPSLLTPRWETFTFSGQSSTSGLLNWNNGRKVVVFFSRLYKYDLQYFNHWMCWTYFFCFFQWSVESEAPKHKAQPPLSFGLLLRPELAFSVLERGPPADSPKVTSPLSLFCVWSVLFHIFAIGVEDIR